MMSLLKTALTATLLIATSFTYAKAQYGPVIENYGPVYKVPELDSPLPENFQYKVIFDIYVTASDPDVHSRRLESVARFLNMHALRGVKLENMHVAVVFHGKATKDILTDDAYQKVHQLDNPNRELIDALADSGVRLYVCGQTTDFLKYKRQDILPEIKIALSAMTQLALYQSQGYALLP